MRHIWCFLLSAGVLLSCGAALAQVGTQASITGIVMDSSEAVISGATITVVQTATHLERTSSSNEGGSFTIQALPIGLYTVTVTAPGMRGWKVDHLELTIGANIKIFPRLKVGSVDTMVTVQASQELQTETNAVTTTIDVPALLNYPNPVRIYFFYG